MCPARCVTHQAHVSGKFTLIICQVMEVLYNVPPKENDAEEVGEGIQST